MEEHAFSTYDSFLSDNEEMLKQQPAPKASVRVLHASGGGLCCRCSSRALCRCCRLRAVVRLAVRRWWCCVCVFLGGIGRKGTERVTRFWFWRGAHAGGELQ